MNVKVLIEIVHPADVLFFKRPIDALRESGNQVLCLSRKKDIACELLDEFSIPHTMISEAGRGLVGLGAELFKRDWALLHAARTFGPDVMAGFGGVAIAHVGAILGIPSLSFYDSENAVLQTRLTWPFITKVFVPEAYRGIVPKDKTERVPGTKELSYFNPTHFSLDRERAQAAGWAPDRMNFFLRFVEWRANHDIGKAGLSSVIQRKVASMLADHGKLHISAEGALPSDLEGYRCRGRLTDIHHLIGHCRMLVGESATMAAEAAILGIPSIYAGRDFPGYIHELSEAGLVRKVMPKEHEQLPLAIEELLEQPVHLFLERRNAYLEAKPDWSEVVLQAIRESGDSRAGTS